MRTLRRSVEALLLVMLALFVNTTTAAVCGPIQTPGSWIWQGMLKPLYSSNSLAYEDNFYTVSRQTCEESVNKYGYAFTGIVGYIEASQLQNTAAFKRYWNSQYHNHFYTHDLAMMSDGVTSEVEFVEANGWVLEGIEGYIYTVEVPGSVPLYRANKWTPATSSLIHEYTTSWPRITSLMAQGWTYDRIAGYVYTTQVPSISGGAVLGSRECGANGIPCSRTNAFPQVGQNSTARLPLSGPQTQVMTFRFMSYDYFSHNADGTSGPAQVGGHFSVALRGLFETPPTNVGPLVPCANPSVPATNCFRTRGAGAIVWGNPSGVSLPAGAAPGNVIPNSGNFGMESWFVGIGRSHVCPGTSVTSPTVCVAQQWTYSGNSSPLRNGTWYEFKLEASDNGLVSARITGTGGSPIYASASWLDMNSYFPVPNESLKWDPTGGYPAHLTGWWLTSATDQRNPFTIYIQQIETYWRVGN